jgi:parvulin-like peptidyl-prolyl isomerase
LVSPTPTSVPTTTPVPTQTVTPTQTPLPTGIPTATPGPTEQKQQYDKNTVDYYQRAAKATGLTEPEIRQILIETALRDKVKGAVVGKPPDQQDQIKSRHILVDTEAQANDLMKALQNGESFAALAKASSKDTGSGAQGGELGWKGKGAYVPEFEAAIWSDKAKVGDVLGPIKSQFGYHVIQIEGHEMRVLSDTEKSNAQTKAFDDWLTQQRTQRNAQTFDVWQDSVPSNPTLTDLGLPEGLSSGQGGGFPQ